MSKPSVPLKQRLVLPTVLIVFGAIWGYGMLRSPVPFGARYMTSSGNEAIYELQGTDALDRARMAAEKAGYQVQNADDGGVLLLNGTAGIRIQRGHFLHAAGPGHIGPTAAVDEAHDAAVIVVTHPEPAWRSWWNRVTRR